MVMKKIPLTQGKVALVDDEDFDELSKWKWQASPARRADGTIRTWYAARSIRAGDRKRWVGMHRQILGVDDPRVDIDHSDGDGLNNQRSNIRRATRQENLRNQRKSSGCSSQYKGVYNHRVGKKRWQAMINDGPVGKTGVARRRSLGYFSSESDAARAYDKAASESFGEFALLNLPTEVCR